MKQVEIFMRCLPWEPTLSEETYECHTQKTFRNATHSETVTERVEIPTDNCPCRDFASATAPSGPSGPACTPESDNPRQCNAGELKQKMLLCSEGVIQRTQTSVAEYTKGTEDMSAKMTTFMAWFQQAWADVYNAQSVVLIMGPVAGAAISFLGMLLYSHTRVLRASRRDATLSGDNCNWANLGIGESGPTGPKPASFGNEGRVGRIGPSRG